MLIEFSIVPVGSGSSIGDRLAEALKIVDASGIPCKVNPMGAVVDGEWDDLFNLIRECYEVAMKHEERVIISISADDRKEKANRLEKKVKSIEQRIGKSVKKRTVRTGLLQPGFGTEHPKRAFNTAQFCGKAPNLQLLVFEGMKILRNTCRTRRMAFFPFDLLNLFQ